MPKMFISYRRSASSGHAGRFYDRLIAEFGADSVFLDVEKIPPGETFSSYLLAKIDECDIFLLMLGEGTLDRCSDPEDWVRREIAYALQHDDVAVVPVLQDGFKMPDPEKLPEDIRDITSRNAAFIFHQMFDESVAKIIDNINSWFPETRPSDTHITSEIPIRVADTASPKSESLHQASSTGTGQVKIHRVGSMLAYRVRPFHIKLDGQEIRQISNNETVVLNVPAGQHLLSVEVDYHNAQQSINISDSELQSFEVQVRNMGLTVSLERV